MDRPGEAIVTTITAPFLELFVRPPGDLFYFLVVFALAQVSLFMALGQRLRHPRERAAQQYLWAALGVVLAWSSLLIGALIALAANQPANALLPPMERAVQAISIALIAWGFITSDSEEWGLLPALILLVGIGVMAVGYVSSAFEWATARTTDEFNRTSAATIWTAISVLIAGGGLLLLILFVRRVQDAPLKALYFLVLLIGFGLTLYQTTQGMLAGSAAGAARLAFITSLVFLPVVIYRLVVGMLEAEVDLLRGTVAPPPPAVSPDTAALSATARMKTSASADDLPPPPIPQQMAAAGTERESAQLMRALGMMLEQASPDTIPERIIEAALNSLKADIGALLIIQDANYADVAVGIDRTMKRRFTGTINLNDQPTLQNAIERRLQRPLYLDRNLDELRDLYTRIDVEQTGPAYFQPLVHERELLAVLLVALPYAGRELNESEQALLKGIGIIAASLLRLSYSAQQARLEAEGRIIQAMVQGVTPDDLPADVALIPAESVRAELEAARQQIADLNREIASLRLLLDDERSKVTDALSDSEEGASISQRIIALNAEYQKMVEERDRLALRLRDAETALATVSAAGPGQDTDQLIRAMLEGVNREREQLVEQRDRLQRELDELRAAIGAPMPQVVREMIDRISVEKARAELERAELSAKLTEIETQLAALGISGGPAGLAQILGELYEQRAALQVRYDALKAERDALVQERQQLEDLMAREEERETQLRKLQSDLIRLAADREAIGRKYDKLRAERDELLARQEALKTNQDQALQQASSIEVALERQHAEEHSLRVQIEALMTERSQLMRERDRLRAERQALEMERDGLLARAEGDRERLAQLGIDGIGSLTAMIDELTTQRTQLETELAEARTKIAALQDRIDMLQLRAGGGQTQVIYRPDNPEQFISMVHELRTPMTSIVGYVDLLLNESAGILGEMQRKFLQRVSSNVSRLEAMLDDLVRITTLDAGRFALEAQPINLVEIIEDAVTRASVQLREKEIAIQLNLDDDLPLIRADRDAMTQVINQLLTNAYLVSPVGGDITISATLYSPARSLNGHTPQTDSILISVQDQGGGIPPEDLPRVFARKYRAENPLVPGLGDTGVGLAIAKALVEAHAGEVWVETQAGLGSAFNCLLPLEPVVESA
jgi:signal transduction histidine kinase